MRRLLYIVLVVGACGGGSKGGDDEGVIGDGVPVDAPEADASMIDAFEPPMPSTIYQTATVPSGPYNGLPAASADPSQLRGVRFTTTRAYTITGLGAHVYSYCTSCATLETFMAVLPVDPTTKLPMTFHLNDAIGWAVANLPVWQRGELPESPPSTVFPASFTLPAGTYALVIGSGRRGVPASEALLPIDVDRVQKNEYIFWNGEGEQGYWANAQVNNTTEFRLFVIGY